MATGEISVLNLPLKTGADISNGDYFLFIDDGILSKILKTDLYASIAVDAKGEKGDVGATGANGPQGTNGWSPVLAVVSDGARRVLQVYDWVGGTGSKPATGSYIGVSGLTGVLASAVDVRGSTGATGASGADATTSLLVEVDVGSTPVPDATFTIASVGMTGTTPVYAQIIGISPTGGRPIDEIYAEQVLVFSRPQTDQVVFNLLPKVGNISGKFVIAYRVG